MKALKVSLRLIRPVFCRFAMSRENMGFTLKK
jgi:hypothetical protein